MKTYWDHTERERAELSSEQVTKLLDLELMEKGVLKVEAPTPEPLATVEVPRQRMYSVLCRGRYMNPEPLDVLFPSIESAEAFLALKPSIRVSEYGIAEPFVREVAAPSIAPVDVPSESAVNAMRAALAENNKRTERNAAAQREYEMALAKVESATRSIWDDWHACRAKSSRMQKVADTRAEYLRLTGGDAALAETFLAKAFSADELRAAAEWSSQVAAS